DRRWNLWEDTAVRAPELKLAIRLSSNLVTLFVHGAMVAPTEHGQVRQRCRPSLSPVADVMTLAEAHAAPWEATAAVAMVKRAAQGWGNRPTLRGHLHDPAVPGVLHHHAAGVAGQTPGRFRGNVPP